jgi:cation diffusion facilitator CzcD-associated flavoprotein CzcO
MFTLGYQFRPWRKARAIADGESIRTYIEETAAEFGIDKRIRFGQKVISADWDSSRSLWTVEADVAGTGPVTYTCSFLYMCSGYYRYEAGYPVDPDFTPRYNPWDQRMCVVPDGDLFRAIAEGRASVATGTIESITETGVRLSSGEELAADIIVTATGLALQMIGGARLSVDGEAVDPGRRWVYRACMLSDVPNFAFCVGYTNASWTLRADLTSRYVCRLLSHMDANGYRVAVPHHEGGGEERPLLDLTSGYVQRAIDQLPKQGTKPPWTIRQNYLLDYFSALYGDLTAGMRFSRRLAPAGESLAA